MTEKKGSLTLIGIGLNGVWDLTRHAIEVIRRADMVLFDTYTSLVTGASLSDFSGFLQREIKPVTRQDIEERAEQEILSAAAQRKVVVLIPGDPMMATTHIDLRLRANKLGIRTSVIHGISIQTAALSACGLENYKQGPSITLPFMTIQYVPDSPYFKLVDNLERGLHTLVFLDIQADKHRFMTVREGLLALLMLEERNMKGVITRDRLVVGLARVGSDSSRIKAETLESLLEYDFGSPPHCMIIPGRLHFMEAEALVAFAGAPQSILSGY